MDDRENSNLVTNIRSALKRDFLEALVSSDVQSKQFSNLK
jgi:hypothetical protein